MMYVYYEVLDQPIRLWIDRRNKHLWISCQKTNYSKIMVKWRYLFDEGKEAEEDKATENLSDADFKKKMDEDLVRRIYEKIERQAGNPNPSGER